MIICNTVRAVREELELQRDKNKTIGFVPTMGALHQGHLELMERAKVENDLLVVSIFVNPIQFNNKNDLESYPRVLDEDIAKLEAIGCDYLFAPSVEEMYPEPINDTYDFGALGNVMEGAFRPGHFNGVAIVVRRLFEIIEPHKSYFGEKDYQQLAIIQDMVRQLAMPVEIIPCPIVREDDGLAMSSRNRRLTESERQLAPTIYKILKKGASLRNVLSPEELRLWARAQIENTEGFLIDYVEVADDTYLQPFEHWNDVKGALIFVALFLGDVRLIDNIRIF